jgi:hypothetical protein
MMRTVNRAALTVLFIALWSMPLSRTTAGTEGRGAPVALSIARDQLLVLEVNGALSKAEMPAGRFSREIYRVSGPFQATDAVEVPTATGTASWLIAYRQLADHNQSWAVRVAAGEKERWVMLPQKGLFGGIGAADDVDKLYLTNSDTNEIYSIPRGTSGAPRYVATVRIVGRLGAIAVDGRRNRLLVGDTDGTIHAVDLGNGKSAILARCPSADIRALAVEPNGNRVFVADSAGERIVTANLGSGNNGGCGAAIKTTDLREPAGLAFDSTNGLWIGDQRAHKIFRISMDPAAAMKTVDW